MAVCTSLRGVTSETSEYLYANKTNVYATALNKETVKIILKLFFAIR